LTDPDGLGSLFGVQLTINIPDELARRLQPELERLEQVIARGLYKPWSESSGLRREVTSFLGRGPTPEEILAFRPSDATVARSQELLQRSKEGKLSAMVEAELDEMAELDHLVSLIKAEALQHSEAAA